MPGSFSHSRKVATLSTVAAAAACLLSFSGCGNSWMSSKERNETPSALMQSAQWAYDKGDFTKAVTIYSKIVAKDPNNASARIRLAYTYNALSGLTPLDLVSKLGKLSSQSKTSGAAAGGTTPAAGSNSISAFAEVVGLPANEKKALAGQSFKTIASLRAASPRFATLHDSWKTICQLIPKKTLDTVIASDTRLAGNLDLTVCKGGLSDAGLSKTSALFAAAMGAMAQAAGLYQIILDADGDGEIDLVKQASTLSKDLEALKAKADAAQANADLSSLQSTLTDVNTKLASLTEMADFLKGELISLALADFSFVAALTANLGMPESMTNSINSTITKFNEAKTKLNEYTSTGSSATSTSSSALKASAQKAAQAVDTLYTKQLSSIEGSSTLTPAQKEEKKAELQTKIGQSCTSFDSLKSAYNLPADTQKPAQCTTSAALNLSDSTSSDTFNAPSEELGLETADANALDAQQGDEGTQALNIGQALVDFSRFGYRLLDEQIGY